VIFLSSILTSEDHPNITSPKICSMLSPFLSSNGSSHPPSIQKPALR
jgi:hypothetical protein